MIWQDVAMLAAVIVIFGIVFWFLTLRNKRR